MAPSLFVVWCVMFADCGLWFVACVAAVCCVLFAVWCLLFAVCWLLCAVFFAVRCLLHVACCLLFVD